MAANVQHFDHLPHFRAQDSSEPMMNADQMFLSPGRQRGLTMLDINFFPVFLGLTGYECWVLSH
jgi:hypothetical protein